MRSFMQGDSMVRLVIIGAGAFAREIIDIIDAMNIAGAGIEIVGLVVDEAYLPSVSSIDDIPVLGELSVLNELQGIQLICAIGDPIARHRIVTQMVQRGHDFVTLIHPSVIWGRHVSLGAGTVVTSGCILSNNIKIGNHCHLNPGVIVGHDCYIHDFVSLAPGARVSGYVEINEGSYIGTGANIIDRIVVGNWSIVGAGATVIRHVPANSTVVGVPAKPISYRPEDWYLR